MDRHVSADRDGLDEEEEEVRSVLSHDEDPITLKTRRSPINVKQSFGLPIRKPALYKKSRTVTRNAEEALCSIPSTQAEKHLLPSNIVRTASFGWWLSLAFFAVSAALYLIPRGGKNYATLVFGLGGTSSGRSGSISRETLPPIPARTTKNRRTEPRREVETMARTLLPPEVAKHNRVAPMSPTGALSPNESPLPVSLPNQVKRPPCPVGERSQASGIRGVMAPSLRIRQLA
jgi:hypothetical protein